MLLDFLGKRARPSADPAPARARAKRESAGAPADDLTTLAHALPEVKEGSGHDDWAAWDAAVAALESSLQALRPMDMSHGRAAEGPLGAAMQSGT